MRYCKGQILVYHFPKRTVKKLKKSNVIEEFHRVVVLHKRETPYKTVLVAPITKATSLSSKGNIPSNYVQILKSDYSAILDEDSYINLDMIMVVDFDDMDKYERYGKSVNVSLNIPDLYQLDYKLALTYELNEYFKFETEKEIQQEMENIVEYIDVDIRNKLRDIITKITDKDVIKDIIEVIDTLVNSIKTNYISKK